MRAARDLRGCASRTARFGAHTRRGGWPQRRARAGTARPRHPLDVALSTTNQARAPHMLPAATPQEGASCPPPELLSLKKSTPRELLPPQSQPPRHALSVLVSILTAAPPPPPTSTSTSPNSISTPHHHACSCRINLPRDYAVPNRAISLSSTHQLAKMGLMWSKHWGGKRFGE